MPSPTLLADAVIATATAALFAHAGNLIRRRQVASADGQRAMRAFSVWWFGLAAFTLLGAVRSLLAYSGNLDVGTHTLLSNLTVVPLVALLWGLVTYLAFIYTGNPRLFTFVTLLHVAIFLFYGYLVLALDPIAVRAEDWSVPIDYADGLSAPVTAAVLLTVLLPTLAAAIGYATLFFRTEDRTARYRIAMTSGAFIFWFGSAALASVTPLGKWYWWPLAARLVGLVATLMVLAAYRPPRAFRERWGIAPVEGVPVETHEPRLRLAAPLQA